jgi:hypothetical protein
MENRLIYFAAPAAEKQEDGIDAPGSEKPDPVKNAGADLAQLESLKAKPGGTESSRQAKEMIASGKVSEFTEKLFTKQVGVVEAAVAARKNNLTPETTEALNKANAVLKKSVDYQKSRLAENATSDAKMQRMAGLDRADEIFKDVKIQIGGKEFAWKKGEMANFKDLPLEGKKDFLKNMETALLASPDGTEKVLAEFKKNKKLPDSWTKDGGYCDNPEKWGQTKAEAAKWLLENADQKILQAETISQFLEQNHQVVQKAGVAKPSLDQVFKMSTSEVNQFIEGARSKIEVVDAEAAKNLEAIGTANAAELQTADSKKVDLQEGEKSKEKAESEKFGILAKKIQESPLRKSLMAKLDKKKDEAKTHNEDDVVNRAAAMRNGEQQAGFLKRIFGKKREMNEQEREQEDTQVHEGATKALTDDLVGIENEGEKQETDTKLTNTEVQQIQEMFDFKEVPKVDGLRNAIAVLVAKDTDAKSTEDAMKKQREFWKNKTNFFA